MHDQNQLIAAVQLLTSRMKGDPTNGILADPDAGPIIAALISSHGCSGLADLASKHPELVIDLADNWYDFEEDLQFSGNPDTGEAWR